MHSSKSPGTARLTFRIPLGTLPQESITTRITANVVVYYIRNPSGPADQLFLFIEIWSWRTLQNVIIRKRWIPDWSQQYIPNMYNVSLTSIACVCNSLFHVLMKDIKSWKLTDKWWESNLQDWLGTNCTQCSGLSFSKSRLWKLWRLSLIFVFTSDGLGDCALFWEWTGMTAWKTKKKDRKLNFFIELELINAILARCWLQVVIYTAVYITSVTADFYEL